MDSDYIILLVGTMGMFILIISFILFSVAFQKKIYQKENEVIKIERSLKSEELKTAYALVEGQFRERQRISQDLHDNLGATLSCNNIYLQLMAKSITSEDQKDHLKKIQEINTTAIDEVRKVSHNLNTNFLGDRSFAESVEKIAAILNGKEKLNVSTSISLPTMIPTELAIDSYQIIQELLNNAIKHSDASVVNLALNSTETAFSIAYKDNGKGFQASNNKEGIGLRNVRSRVEKHQGNVRLKTAFGRGTEYSISFSLS